MSLESWSLSASAPTELRIFSTSPEDGVAFPPRTHCTKSKGKRKPGRQYFRRSFVCLSLSLSSLAAKRRGATRPPSTGDRCEASRLRCRAAASLEHARVLALDQNQRRGLQEPSLTPFFSFPPFFSRARRVAKRSPRGRTASSLSSCHSPIGRLRFAS